MAIRSFYGRATAVAQVSTAQVTAYDAATTYRLTVGGVIVSTIAAGGVNQTATALAAAWNASTHPYFTGVTASAATDTVTLTADTAGVPFEVTSSVSGGTGTIGAVATPTASAGPNDFSTATNWTGDTVPGNGDTIVLKDCNVDILWGWAAQSGKTFAEVQHYSSFTGKIGLNQRVFQKTATTTDTTADEYREHYGRGGVTLTRTGIQSGIGTNSGSGRFKWNYGAVQNTTIVESTATTSTDGNGLEPVRLIGTHASNVLVVQSGTVGVATNDPGEAATFATVSAGTEGGSSLASFGGSSATVNLGSGCTLTTVNINGATVNNLGAALPTLNQIGGTYLAQGSGAHTTINNHSGKCDYRSDGTLTTLNLAGVFDTSLDPRPKTITNTKINKGCTLNLATGRPLSVTLTNGLQFQTGASLQNCSINLGYGFTLPNPT